MEIDDQKNSSEAGREHRATPSARMETHSQVSAAPSFTPWTGTQGAHSAFGDEFAVWREGYVGDGKNGLVASWIKSEADARLIVAAPALRTALMELLDCETNMAGCSGIKLLDAVDKARAALALAETPIEG